MATKVNERTGEHAVGYGDRHLIRTLRGGVKAMRAASTVYLPKLEKEDEEKGRYQRRLNGAILFNALSRTVDQLSAKPFGKPVTAKVISARLQSKAEERTATWANDIDYNSVDLTQFGRKIAKAALYDGTSHVLVDYREDISRPVALFYDADSVLGGRVDSNGELSMVRLLEMIEIEDGEWGSKTAQRVRVFRRTGKVVEWAVWTEDGEGGEMVMTQEWKKHHLDYIPFFTLFADPESATGPLTAPAPFQDLAELNRFHWELSSHKNRTLVVVGSPILFFSGDVDDDENEGVNSLKLGTEYAIAASQGSDMKYVEHTGMAVKTISEAMQELVTQMMALGLEFVALRQGGETATGRALDAAGTNSLLSAMALGVGSVLRHVLVAFADFEGLADFEVAVDVNTDYGLKLSSEELQALNSARASGDISRREYLAELQRRGVLRLGFDFALNDAELEAEEDNAVGGGSGGFGFGHGRAAN